MTAFSVMPGMLIDLSEILSYAQGVNTIAVFLALVLGLALGLGIASLLFAIHLGRWNHRLRCRPKPGLVHGPQHRRGPAANWAGLCHWVAIRDSHPERVQETLRLHNPIACSWEEGLSAAHERKLFIAPPVAGWTLVMGASLPQPAEDVDACFHFLRHLSEKLGEVQFFSSHRSLQQHAWIRAEGGRIVRAYAWAGKTVWNEGAMTTAERELGLTCYAYGEGPARLPWNQAHPVVMNTERVALLAGCWSVNPATIDVRFPRAGHGIAGRLSLPQAI